MSRTLPTSAGERCWARIGVDGDRSCPELSTFIHCRNCPAHSEGGRSLLEGAPPAGSREEWAERLGDAPPAEASDSRSFLVCRVGSEWLGLPAHLAQEVLDLRVVRRLPHRSSPAFPGLVNVRGAILPCCAPAALLGIPPANDEERARRLVVIAPEGRLWVLIADEIAGLHVVETSAIKPAPSTVTLAGGSCSSGLLEWKGRQVSLLDERRLGERLQEALG